MLAGGEVGGDGQWDPARQDQLDRPLAIRLEILLGNQQVGKGEGYGIHLRHLQQKDQLSDKSAKLLVVNVPALKLLWLDARQLPILLVPKTSIEYYMEQLLPTLKQYLRRSLHLLLGQGFPSLHVIIYHYRV